MGRQDELFHVLKVIRRIVDVADEGIGPAIEHVSRDRAHLDELRNGILGKEATQRTDLVRLVNRIESTIRELHALGHFLISERETLGKALDEIRSALELVNLPPRTRNLGETARGTDATAADQ